MNPREESASYKAINWLILISCALIWGCSYYLIKKGLYGFNPAEISGIRIVSAGLCLLPFMYAAIKKIPRKKYPYVLLSALLGYGIPTYLYPLAQTHISSGVAGIINSLTPLCTYLIGILFYNMPNSRMKFAGVLIGMIGVVCLIVFKPQQEFKADVLFVGIALLAPVLYGINNNIRKTNLSGLPGVPLTALIFGILMPPSIFLVGASEVPEKIISSDAAKHALPYVIALGVFGTAIAMSLANILIQRVDLMFATTVTYLMPVVSVGIGMVDHEEIHWYEFLGLSLILGGVLLINFVKTTGK